MSLDVGGGGGGDARGALGTIKDWVQARIAEALRAHIGRTWLFVNGIAVAARHKIDVQITGATGEDHPELDLVRVILPESGGGSGVWTEITRYAVTDPAGEAPITFDDLDQTYDALWVFGKVTSVDDVYAENVQVYFNDDPGTDCLYTYQRSGRDEFAVNVHSISINDGASSQDFIVIGFAPGVDTSAGSMGSFDFVLPNYAHATAVKSLNARWGSNRGSAQFQATGFGVWRGLSGGPTAPPITKLVFWPNQFSGNLFAEGSEIIIYGLKTS